MSLSGLLYVMCCDDDRSFTVSRYCHQMFPDSDTINQKEGAQYVSQKCSALSSFVLQEI